MRYELVRWVTGKGFAIRDTEQDEYIRNLDNEVRCGTLGDMADECLFLNDRERDYADYSERAWEEFCDAMGDDPMEYADDDFPGYEESYQDSRYYPYGHVDADDYTSQNR
jgi:hypothetical protein